MPEADFVSLAEMLIRSIEEPVVALTPPPEPRDEGPYDERIQAALRDARLFQARLADAFDEAASRLLRELAADVVGRELRLAPCDIAHIVRRTRAGAPVVAVRIAPEDAAALVDVPVVIDATLRSGDAIVELTGGAIDARLGVRLAQVLEAFA